MITLGEIFRTYGPAYRAQFGERMLPSQHAAMRAIETCRTEALGGQVYRCPSCATTRYSYHSCRNRHCPTCQQDAAQTWLARQQELLLPVPYFLVTFTLPAELRDVAYRHQRTLYNLLFRASAAALMELARDPRFLGAQIGLVGVLQTWTRDLRYHPHIHYLVPGGGLAGDGCTWVSPKADFLVHVKPLAALFRAKLRAALRQTTLWAEIPATVWQQPWVVDCRSVGTARAALKYLAPYIFRVALSNNRIVRVVDDQITFRYSIGDTGQTAYCTLPVQEFLHRFLQHILPKGFVKVRYYGLFRLGMRRSLSRLRSQLQLLQQSVDQAMPAPAASDNSPQVVICPSCGQPMRLERVLLRHNRGPPQLGQRARAAKARQVQALSEMACHAHACFGVPERASDDQAPVQVRRQPWQSSAEVCARACGQHPRGERVQTGETANQRRAAFEQSHPCANPQMKFHI